MRIFTVTPNYGARFTDRILSDFMSDFATDAPSYDFEEAEGHYLLSMDMPGVKKEDIQISMEENWLSISAERRLKNSEQAVRKYEQSFKAPATVNPEQIQAHYEDGVLRVALPKAESAKRRMIQLQNGPSGFLSKLIGSEKETH